jgi:hypothetical protein
MSRHGAISSGKAIGTGGRPRERSFARRWFVGAALVLLIVGGSAAWYRLRETRLNAIRELRKEIFSGQLSADERRKKLERLRAEENTLSSADRQKLRSEGMRRRTAELNRYFGLSKAAKTSVLDEFIAREERRRKEWRAGAGPGDPAVGGPPFGGPRSNATTAATNFASASERDKRREDFLDSMSATQRAEWTEFRKDLTVRRQQLGLPPIGRP